jgi:hypothetical protein
MKKIKNGTKLWQSTAIQLIRFVDENFVCPKIKLFFISGGRKKLCLESLLFLPRWTSEKEGHTDRRSKSSVYVEEWEEKKNKVVEPRKMEKKNKQRKFAVRKSIYFRSGMGKYFQQEM